MAENINFDMDDLGLGDFSDIDLFKQDDKKGKAAVNKVNVVEEKDLIYDKEYGCPVCDHKFTSKTVKTGKNKLMSTDTDLRPLYKELDSNKYDAVTCPICGYGVLARYFVPLSDRQVKECREQIASKYRGSKPDNTEMYTYDEALKRFKLVLISCIVKNSKASEKAYTCLKLAWLCRGKAESLNEDDKEIEVLRVQELKFIQNAIEGFEKALSNENLPICDMDEHTLSYLLADLHRRTGNPDTTLKYLSKVITSRNASDRLKDRARDLKDLIKEVK
jgi:uncharacterized protein (DUF2225 family)